MKPNSPRCDLFILSAVTDLSFLKFTIPHQLKQCKVNGKRVLRIDTSPVSGYYKNHRELSRLSELKDLGNNLLNKGLIDEVLQIDYNQELINSAYRKHFGKNFPETHCFRGYPYYGSILPFESSDSEYIAHLDSDMLIYQEEGFDWIKESIEIMENNSDILCCLPLSGPPTQNGSLIQGISKYDFDSDRNVYLFKNFTSRIFIINQKRFSSLLPMDILWLSWREKIKSKILGCGKLLCWEASVSNALEKSCYYRADLASKSAWSLHPYERSERFYKNIEYLTKSIESGFFPDKQAGQYELVLDWWV